MKRIHVICPNCGAILEVDSIPSIINCEYCGSPLILNGGVSKNNAEEIGYQFEKGRQRAQEEVRQSQPQQIYDEQPLKKKRPTWLWVLGWVFIFPLPLTMILLRKKSMNSIIKYGIIAASWLFYFLLALLGYSDNTKESVKETTSSLSTANSTDIETVESSQRDSAEQNTAEEKQAETVDTKTEEAALDTAEPSNETLGENDLLQAFYDDFDSNGNYDNLKNMVMRYGLVYDSRKTGMGSELYRVAVSDDIANVFKHKEGDHIVIEFNLLQKNRLTSLQFHKVEDETTTEAPKEMNSLLEMFASINSATSRDDIDAFIEENGLEKTAFTHDSGYYLGYLYDAVRKRGRDRVGEALDVNFVTSGDINRLGLVSSASYTIHTGSSTKYELKYEDGVFYYKGDPCINGEEAVQKFLGNE